jgi:hypothetical protein
MLSVAAWRQGRWHPASAACLARWRRLGWNGLARSLRPVESGRLRPAAATGTRVEFQLLLSHGDVLAALGRPHEAAETCLQTADLVTIDIHDVVAAPLPDIRRLEHADLLHPVLAPSSAGGAAAVPGRLEVMAPAADRVTHHAEQGENGADDNDDSDRPDDGYLCDEADNEKNYAEDNHGNF